MSVMNEEGAFAARTACRGGFGNDKCSNVMKELDLDTPKKITQSLILSDQSPFLSWSFDSHSFSAGWAVCLSLLVILETWVLDHQFCILLEGQGKEGNE